MKRNNWQLAISLWLLANGKRSKANSQWPILLILPVAVLSLQCSDNPNEIVLEKGVRFSVLAKLPRVLKESSGIEIAASGGFWSFNDSKGEAALYRFDTLGNMQQTLEIVNASNVDWEDITKDKEGSLYISDTGNNKNDRKDLTIYKISELGKGSRNNKAIAEKIQYRFPEQTEFPPPRNECFFDVEGIFTKETYLYLLTRDRSKPFVGKTRLYRLPNVPGEYILEYLDEFMTDKDKKLGKVTSADLSPNGSTLAILSYGLIWLFKDFHGDDFFAGNVTQIEMPMQWEWEGLVFKDDCTLYLTKEKGSKRPPLLFRMALCNVET